MKCRPVEERKAVRGTQVCSDSTPPQAFLPSYQAFSYKRKHEYTATCSEN